MDNHPCLMCWMRSSVQQMAKDYVTLNVAIGSGYNFGGAAIRPNSYEH